MKENERTVKGNERKMKRTATWGKNAKRGEKVLFIRAKREKKIESLTHTTSVGLVGWPLGKQKIEIVSHTTSVGLAGWPLRK